MIFVLCFLLLQRISFFILFSYMYYVFRFLYLLLFLCIDGEISVNLFIGPLSANPAKLLIILKQFVGNSRRIVWVCLTILWGWCLKS